MALDYGLFFSLIWLIPFLAQIALMVYAILKVSQHPVGELASLPKILWYVIIIFFPLIGSIVALVVCTQEKKKLADPRFMAPGVYGHGAAGYYGPMTPGGPAGPGNYQAGGYQGGNYQAGNYQSGNYQGGNYQGGAQPSSPDRPHSSSGNQPQ